MSDSLEFAFVFPGQGSQSVGMLADLATEMPVVQETFGEASDALGLDLWRLAQEGPKEDLNLTHNTQPCMLAAGVAAWRAWELSAGPRPRCLAGHSLGEYTALVCAGSLEFDEAARIVADRGRFMQEAVPQGEGAMAAVLGLDDEQVESVCQEARQTEVVAAVNFNSPGQVVIAGNRSAVERAAALAKTRGARRALMLPVSVPSHCSLMTPAADRLAERLAGVTIREPVVPVIHNVNAQQAVDPDGIRELLVRQIHNPVRWVDSVRQMTTMGVGALLEGGPGKVLTGLTKRIDPGLKGLAVDAPATLRSALEALGHVG